MTEFHGWKVTKPDTFALFISEDNAAILLKHEGSIVSEIEFVDSGLKIKYSSRLVIINSDDKIISFR